MSWIQRLLASLGLGESRRAHAPTGARSGRTAAGSVECARCGFRVRVRAPRCPRCGGRVVWPGDDTGSAPARENKTSPRISRVPAGLTQLQQRILAATRDADDGLIHVIPASGPDAGEIKAGLTRISGSEAVDSVQLLTRTGMLTRVGETTFSLTVEGHAAAQELDKPQG